MVVSLASAVACATWSVALPPPGGAMNVPSSFAQWKLFTPEPPAKVGVVVEGLRWILLAPELREGPSRALEWGNRAGGSRGVVLQAYTRSALEEVVYEMNSL